MPLVLGRALCWLATGIRIGRGDSQDEVKKITITARSAHISRHVANVQRGKRLWRLSRILGLCKTMRDKVGDQNCLILSAGSSWYWMLGCWGWALGRDSRARLFGCEIDRRRASAGTCCALGRVHCKASCAVEQWDDFSRGSTG